MKFYTRIILVFIICLCAPRVQAQVAGFTASAVAGCAPLGVTFTNTSTGATSYYWNMGGTPSTLVNPGTTFTLPGTYTITLTAYNGSSSSTYSITVTVYPDPIVSFTGSPRSGCPGTTVNFTSTTIASAPGAMTNTWNFGDGGGAGPTTSMTASETYLTPGYYRVTLDVTNSNGCRGNLAVDSFIHIFTPPTPFFTASPAISCQAPATVTFTDMSAGTGPMSSISWSFGDGFFGSGSPCTHTYTTPGSYNVTLTVVDANGCSATTTVSNSVYIGNLSAAFTHTTTACVFNNVAFTNTTPGAYTSSHWDFGDFTTSTAVHATHSYSAPGSYNVELIIGNMGCFDTIVHTINIIPRPPISISGTPTQPCPAPATLTFTAFGAPSTSVLTWEFGNHSMGSGNPVTYTRPIRGIDTNKLFFYDPATGCRDTIIYKDTVYDLIHTMVVNPFAGCLPLAVNFSELIQTAEPDTTMPLSPYPFPFTSWTWTFGDGSAPGSSPSPTHTYTAVGIYRPSFIGVTSNGCVVYDTGWVLVGTPPSITFAPLPDHICYREIALFHIYVTAGSPMPTTYKWQFGDSTADSSMLYPIKDHHFRYPGFFTTTVTPYYNGCPGLPVTYGPITIDSPKAIFGYTVACTPRGQVTFNNVSVGSNDYFWDFGDGGTSTLMNPVHIYTALGSYSIMLATHNIRSGCRDTTFQGFIFNAQIVTIVANPPAICKDDTTTFTATLNTGGISGIVWSARQNPSGALFSPMGIWPTYPTDMTIIQNFVLPGIYDITFDYNDQYGCPQQVVRPGYFTVAKPIANFTFIPPTGCSPLAVRFTDISTDVPGTYMTRYAWDFGDGTTSTISSNPTTHIYIPAGTYTITEVVTDNIGCKDTVTLWPVVVNIPHASMMVSNRNPCVGAPDVFNNTSTGAVSYWWDFGDGTTSTLISPIHIYSANGTYTVKLVAVDANGCPDTAIYPGHIGVLSPTAAFTMDDSVSICPPLLVHFYNNSIGAYSYAWDFGDGTSSLFFNPTDMYTTSSYFLVRLIATNAYGCTDTAYGHVNIFGYAGAFTYSPLTGCAPLTVNFTASLSNVPNILWDFVDGTTLAATNSDTASHTYLTPGAYVPRLILSDNTGCHSSSTGLDTIKVDAVIAGFTTVPNPVCVNGTMYFQDTSHTFFSPITSLLWTFTEGDTTSLTSPSRVYSVVGTFPVTLTAINGWGCIASVTNNVSVYPPPTIDAGPDTIICVSDAATLLATGGITYTWGAPATLSCTACNPTKASPTIVTTYTVTGTDEHGCTNWDTVIVSLKTKTESVAKGDTAVCYGVTVPLEDSGGYLYTWIPASGLNNNHIANPKATPEQTTNYMVISQLGSCIPDTNFVKVIVHPLPTVEAGKNQNLVAGSTFQIEATGWNVAVYDWVDDATLSCDSCSNPVASMSVSTTYYVDATSSFGCKAGDSISVFIFCDQSQIFIPNAFTPNGDGQNDIFFPRGRGVKAIKTFRIYNRWGELVHERNNIVINDVSSAWDGSYSGNKPRPDVYVYILEAICDTGEPISIKGDVTIIR